MSLSTFLLEWNNDAQGVKHLFVAIHQCLLSLGAELEYKARPGISHFLRARHNAQRRDLFVLVDVIDDDPQARWLSVCFYADLVRDTQGRGDVVPGGLKGEDACCFDLDSTSEATQNYILSLLREAFANAAKE